MRHGVIHAVTVGGTIAREQADQTMFVMEANANYEPGDELTISYGDHRSSYNFFVYSGFIPRGQTYGDFVNLNVVDPKGDVRAELYGCVGVDGRPQRHWLDKVVKVRKGGNVLDVLRDISRALEKHMASWPTGYETDMKKLADMTTYGSLYAALSYRTRFKALYSRLRTNVQAALQAGNANDLQYSAPEDRNNECYKYKRRRFNDQDWAMDWMDVQLSAS